MMRFYKLPKFKRNDKVIYLKYFKQLPYLHLLRQSCQTSNRSVENIIITLIWFLCNVSNNLLQQRLLVCYKCISQKVANANEYSKITIPNNQLNNCYKNATFFSIKHYKIIRVKIISDFTYYIHLVSLYCYGKLRLKFGHQEVNLQQSRKQTTCDCERNK